MGDAHPIAALLKILLPFVVVAAFFILFNRMALARKKRFDAMGSELARRLGGSFLPGDWPVFTFPMNGRQARLSWGREKGEGARTVVSVDFRGLSPGVLKVFPESLASRFGKIFGTQDLKIGDDAFDARFVVRAQPASLVDRLFDAAGRRRFANLMATFDGRMCVDLSRDRLSVSLPICLRTESEVEGFAKIVAQLGELLLGLGLGGEFWLDRLETTPGRCPVCASEMTVKLVACELCETRHHEDCWRYARSCSTYACRGRRPRRVQEC